MAIMFTKTLGKLKIVDNYLVYMSQIIAKITMPWRSFGSFKVPSTALLAALVVAEGNTSDNGPSHFLNTVGPA